MVTVQDQKFNNYNKKTYFELRGLSTDKKPTDTFGGVGIANGSVFLELDTETLCFYDESTSSWLGGEAE